MFSSPDARTSMARLPRFMCCMAKLDQWMAQLMDAMLDGLSKLPTYDHMHFAPGHEISTCKAFAPGNALAPDMHLHLDMHMRLERHLHLECTCTWTNT